MKKMKLAVVFAAVVSVFGFSSCLDSGESGPRYNYDNVTISNYMGTYTLLSDALPGVTYVTDAFDLTPYGIAKGSKRAAIAYTIPEGTDLTQKRIKIDLVQGMCQGFGSLESLLSAQSDSISGIYTSKVNSLGYLQGNDNVMRVGNVYYSAISASNGFLNLSFTYAVDKPGKVILEENRIGNDTLYVDLRVAAEIKESTSVQSDWRSFDLSRGRLVYDVIPQNPTGDSIYVTVLADVTKDGGKKDSLTVFTKALR